MEGKPWPNLEAEGLLPSKFRPRQVLSFILFNRTVANSHPTFQSYNARQQRAEEKKTDKKEGERQQYG